MKAKHILLFTLLTLSIYSVKAQKFKFLSSYDGNGVPALAGRDNISTNFINNIKASVPESFPVPTFHPEYIADATESDVKLTAAADVWVSFVSEGASYRNVLGFYTYSLNSPLTKEPADEDITIIFPNVSFAGSGGGLNAGDKVYLGRFPANTGIGWVLYANGFNGSVTKGLWQLYSNYRFNPESKSTLRRHNVLLKDPTSNRIVLTFEDIRRDNSNCDQDFNDVVFFVTTNPESSVIKSDIVDLTVTGNSVSSGSEGGLESEGSLADKIAQRNFTRQVTPQLDYDHVQPAMRYRQNTSAARMSSDLALFTSEKPFEGYSDLENVIAQTSTPEDLKAITNATDVLSVDYFQDNARIASFLSTYTPTGVYNHTKAICDRLNKAKLVSMKTVSINDAPFILVQLQQENGDMEYAISFSGYLDNNKLVVESHWTIDEYPANRAYYNFQAWSNAPHLTMQLVIEALKKAGSIYEVVQNQTVATLPKVFVKTGQYENGLLELTLSNPSALNGQLTIKGVLARSETNKNKESWTKTVTLSGATEENVIVPVGQLFDSGVSIMNSIDSQADNLYLADAPWGYAMATGAGAVSEYTVSNNDGTTPATRTENYLLERNVNLKGTVKTYVSLFKMIEPSAKPLNMSAYGTLKFKAQGTGTIDLVILKKSISDYQEQFRISVPLSSTERQYMYSLSDFKSTKGGTLKADDVTTVVFGIAGDNATSKPFEISVKDLTFSTQLIMATEEEPTSSLAQLVAYPNPCIEDKVKLNFDLNQGSDYTVSLYNFMGKKVYQTDKRGVQGSNEVTLNVASFMRGTYVCELKHAEGVLKTKVVLD